jgi:hypothetical protein
MDFGNKENINRSINIPTAQIDKTENIRILKFELLY